MITPIFCFSGDDIDIIHQQIIRKIVADGNDLKFGDITEIKFAREAYFTVQLYGKAIKDVINGKTPKRCNFKGDMVKAFQDSFTAKSVKSEHDYSYPQLLRMWPVSKYASKVNIPDEVIYPVYNQMVAATSLLIADKRDDIQSNRNVGILYHPYMLNMKEKPCFNWFQVGYNGNNKVSLRFLFRSHDYIHGLWPNLCGLAEGFYVLVVEPAGCEIEEIIVTSTSGHSYKNDSQEAERISGYRWDLRTEMIQG